jgi:putative sterol carrier protein
MAIQFPSQEWADAFKAEVNSSDSYASAAKTWEGDFYFVIEGDETRALYVDLWHGAARDIVYVTSLDHNPEFTITGNMDKWKKVIQGKQDPVQALVTRALKLDGNLVKIMKNVKAAQELVRCATLVDTEFAS